MKTTIITFLFIFQSLVTFGGDLIADIQYGDTEDTVLQKLGKSDLVSSGLDSSLFARTGINGSFETTNKLQGMKFKLYFDWKSAPGGRQLTQMTYRSRPIAISAYNTSLKTAWKYSQNLLSAMFGKPSNSGDFPRFKDIQESSLMYSHAWKTTEGFVYLGVGKENGKLNLSISFHKNKLTGH